MHWFLEALNILKDERGFINFGMSKSDSSSNARAGLAMTGQEGIGSRVAIDSLNQTAGLAREAASAPFGTYMGQKITDFMPVGQFGLHPAVDQAMQGTMRDMFGRSSATMARRGGMTPESFSGAVKSSGVEAMKYLTPQIMDYQKYLAELAPKLYGQRLGFAAEPARIAAPLLGSYSTAGSSSLGFGFGIGSQNPSSGPMAAV